MNGTYRYHVKTLAQVDGSGNYCSGSSPAVNWDYVVGCYFGATSYSVVDDGTTASLPSDCTLVSGAAFTPTASSTNSTWIIIGVVAGAVILVVLVALLLLKARKGVVLKNSGGNDMITEL